MSEFERLNDQEKQYVINHPYCAYIIQGNRDKTFRETERRFRMNKSNDHACGSSLLLVSPNFSRSGLLRRYTIDHTS